MELLRFSKEEGVLGVLRMTWHLPSTGPGARCPLQGRLHLLQVRGGCTSATFSFTATASTESVMRGVEEEMEEVEGRGWPGGGPPSPGPSSAWQGHGGAGAGLILE